LKFRKEYFRNVLRIAKLWNIKLMNEDDVPPYRKNVIRCEENGSAFIDLKKRLFFQNLDMSKIHLKERLDVIKKTLVTLDNCHK
jgi:hypothetical protein